MPSIYSTQHVGKPTPQRRRCCARGLLQPRVKRWRPTAIALDASAPLTAQPSLLPSAQAPDFRPYVALDATHLERWRGHALTRIGEPAAVDVLSSALERLDPTFARAESALHVDLASALAATDEHERAQTHLARAETLAATVGSNRQGARALALKGTFRSTS